VGDRLYFISNLSGRLSLYAMDVTGSVPEPLLPADIALPNPHHLEAAVVFRVLPSLGRILLMLDHEGDENYQPVFVPIDGGLPKPVFGDRFAGQQVVCTHCDPETNGALFVVDPRDSATYTAWRADLGERTLEQIGASIYGSAPVAQTPDLKTVLLEDQYTFGDSALYLWREGEGERRLLFGRPLDARAPGESVPPNGIRTPWMVDGSVLLVTSLFDDHYGLASFPLDAPEEIAPVEITGLRHAGTGELEALKHEPGEPPTLTYNIDGASWVYEGEYDAAARRFTATRVLVGESPLAAGVLESLHYDVEGGRYALSFSSATSPTQLYTIERNGALRQLTRERPVGIPLELLSAGEERAYTSHDGMRIPARLYLPAPALGFAGPRPVIFYIHGGPQSQERPDYTWFSMPLIQYFTLNGFAVWVPNVRGSTGYGLDYMKRVDHDWGGQDRLDHTAALEFLRDDPRLDLGRAGVMGRSYGGYMTLTLVGRHPEHWRAACDMFGPYNLFSFIDRLPATWQTYFHIAVGHPERDLNLLAERSPSTHLQNLACPLLVIQGAHDPRVTEPESRDVVEDLRAQGKQVEYVVYPDEGHDVLTYANRVDCYSRIVAFFAAHLHP
jgi:pimeloyl-ACP methyl ester carboxylesterase